MKYFSFHMPIFLNKLDLIITAAPATAQTDVGLFEVGKYGKNVFLPNQYCLIAFIKVWGGKTEFCVEPSASINFGAIKPMSLCFFK